MNTWTTMGYIGFTICVAWIYFIIAIGSIGSIFLVLRAILFLLKKKRPIITIPSRRFVLNGIALSLIFVFGVTIRVYMKERSVWLRDEISYRTAREYFVCGQVLNGFRRLLTRFVHPEHALVKPLTAMQKRIYDKGSVLLPENDGEEGMWLDLWFISHYSMNSYTTRDEQKRNRYYYPFDMIRLTDQCWYSIHTCMTRSFSDKCMEERQFLMNIPRMLFYYSFYQNYSLGYRSGSDQYALEEPVLIGRSKQIEFWTELLREKWKASDYIHEELRKHPKLEATMDVVQLIELRNIIRTNIRLSHFSCSDEHVTKYKRLVEFFVLNSNSAIYKIKNSTQRNRLFSIAMKPYNAAFVTNYILKDHCGYEMDQAILNINKTPFDILYGNYDYEINKLKEYQNRNE